MLFITLFGATTVVTADRTLAESDLPGVKPRQILEILALSPGTPVAKDRLAELLWDGEPPRSYPGTLESYVCVLRRALRGEGARDSVLATTPSGYVLDPNQVRVDLGGVHLLLGRAETAEPLTAVRLAENALDLARGQLLSSSPYPEWAVRQREALDRTLGAALARAAGHAVAERQHERAVTLARAAVSRDPLAEEGWHQLMRALRGCGRRSEALRAYADLRRTMADELGVEPAPAVRALYMELLHEEQSVPGARAAGRAEVQALLELLRHAMEGVPGLELDPADARLVRAAQQLHAA